MIASKRLAGLRIALPSSGSVGQGRQSCPIENDVHFKRPPRVVITVNTTWNLINFRSGLIRALVSAGCEVIALSPVDRYEAQLINLGCRHVPLAIDQHGTSPWRDLGLVLRYWASLRRLRPDVMLGYTAKPNIFGSLAAQALGIPVINNIAGLGAAFARRGLLNRIVIGLYRLALRRSKRVFFQNPEDRDLFVRLGLVSREQCRRLPGSGVDLARFETRADETPADRPVRFLLVARLLWDKGIREYSEAARQLRAEGCDATFQLLGPPQEGSRDAVPVAQLAAWNTEGPIDYLGQTDDVRPFLSAADCVVLPTHYREGLPRVLLEAAAMGRPLITTDAPGCRETVEDGVNGYLVQVRSEASLLAAFRRFLALSPEQRRAMGRASRARVERDFDERRVIDAYAAAIEDALDQG